MNPYIAVLVLMGLASAAFGQEVYFVNHLPDTRLMKVDLDGSEVTTVLTHAELRAAIVAAIPEATDVEETGNLSYFYIDSVHRSLYLSSSYMHSESGNLPVLLRSDLDGADIEVVFNPGAAGSSSGETFQWPQVLQETLSVPAVSTWGLAVMVLLFGIAATAMIKRRSLCCSTKASHIASPSPSAPIYELTDRRSANRLKTAPGAS